jgi:hypothetical protein
MIFFDGMIDGFGIGVYHDTSEMLKDASIDWKSNI